MEARAHCVGYGGETLCTFNQVSETIKQIILKIFNFKYELLDISKFLSLSEDVCAEIEQIGQTFVTLALKLREKCFVDNHSVREEKAKCARPDVDTASNKSFGLCDTKNKKDLLDQLNVSTLSIEQQKNDNIQSQIDEFRLIQEDRLARLEEKVKQAETLLKEKLKVKKLDKRKEQEQRVLKIGQVYNTRLHKKEERKKSSTTRVSALPQCQSKVTEQGYEHIRLGSPVPPRSLEEKKGELQLQEEIKWSRITPISVHGARRRYHQTFHKRT